MPPHLHPKSTATSTLFAGTLLASFIVVGIPHVFPCPRPRTGYADSEIQFDEDGRPIRRNKARRISADPRPSITAGGEEVPEPVLPLPVPSLAARKALAQSKDLKEEAALFQALQREAEVLEKEAREARECPVPKPRGTLGRLLGFEDRKALATVDEKS